jgi:hypothetical protein
VLSPVAAAIATTIAGTVLHATRGRYETWAVIAVALCFFALLTLHKPLVPARALPSLFLALGGVLSAFWALYPCWAYVERFRTEQVLRGVCAGAAVALAVAAVRVWQGRPAVRALGVALVALAFVRLIVPWLSPHPFIDSWTLQQEGGAALLAGHNPYTQGYSQLYPFERFGYRSHFGYLPLIAGFDALATLLVRDVRWAYALCDLATVGLLARIAAGGPWRQVPAERRLLGTAVGLWFLAQPYGAFVIEQCWSEPLLLCLAAASIVSWQATDVSAGIWLGVTLAAKQTNALLAPLAWAAARDRRSSRVHTAAAAAVAVAVTLPLAVADWSAFLRSTVFVFTQMPPRTDGFSLWTVAYVETGRELPAWIAAFAAAPFVGVALLHAFRRRPVACLTWTALAYHALFLTSRQSFGNYHWFAFGLTTLALAARLSGGATATRSPGTA